VRDITAWSIAVLESDAMIIADLNAVISFSANLTSQLERASSNAASKRSLQRLEKQRSLKQLWSCHETQANKGRMIRKKYCPRVEGAGWNEAVQRSDYAMTILARDINCNIPTAYGSRVLTHWQAYNCRMLIKGDEQ